jgi:glutaryl-CoA dehydrogenase
MIDLFRFDELLTDDEKLVRDSVRSFVQARVMPLIRDCWREGRFPLELLPEMASLGLLGATLKGYGCAGLGQVAYGLAMQELERADSGVRSFVSVQNGLVMFPIHAFGSEQQKDRWLPLLAQGKAVGCFGLTEADFGSNPAGMRTTARRDGAHYVLNGSKMWITNGTLADVAVVFARCDDRVRGFLVDKGTPGFTSREIHGKMSLRASVTAELLFEDCRIPAENALPEAVGLRSALACLNRARYSIAWGAIGSASACFEEALEYAKNRVQFTRPIAGYQLVQEKLVTMYNEIVKAQLLTLRLAQVVDRSWEDATAISVAKRNNVKMALEAARTGREILGANGVVDDYACMRHACNLEAVYTYEGTHDIHTLIVGQRLTGIAAFT